MLMLLTTTMNETNEVLEQFITKKKAVFGMLRSVTLVKNRRYGGRYRLHHQGDKKRRARNYQSSSALFRLLVTANVVPSSPNLVILMMEAILSSETSVLTRAARHNTPEDGNPHSHRRVKPQILHSNNRLGFVAEK
jgi:hypothetical protein